MSRFLFYTDLQLTGLRPRHRVDDYPKALLSKLAEVYRLAEEEHCDFVVCGGDFFNRYRLFSYDVINDMSDIVESSPLLTYMAVGQHDIHGYNPNTYRASTLSFVVRRSQRMQVLWKPVELKDLVLYPAHVWETWEDVKKQSVSRKKKSVCVAHQPMLRGTAPFEVINVDEQNDCPFDLVVSGDIHAGYKVVKVGKTVFCNPGAMARQTVREVDRVVQAAIVDCNPREDVQVRYVPLKSAVAGDKVFGQEVMEQNEQASEIDVGEFVEDMLELEAESVDIFELINKVALKVGLDQEVLTYIMSKKV